MLPGLKNKGHNLENKKILAKGTEITWKPSSFKGTLSNAFDTLSIKLNNPCGKESLEYDPQRSANLGAERAALGEMVELGHSVFHKVRFY